MPGLAEPKPPAGDPSSATARGEPALRPGLARGGDIDWPGEYRTLARRLPAIAARSRLTVGGFSTCIDVYFSLRDALPPLASAAASSPEGNALLAELKHRAATGVGGEFFIDWPAGPAWIDAHVSGRRAIGGTSAQAAYMLAALGAPALIAAEDRSEDQLSVLHPGTLIATGAEIVPALKVPRSGSGRPPHYIFEFTAGEKIGGTTVPRSSRTIVRFDHSELQRDAAFVAASTAEASRAGAGILCGFNEIPPERAEDELAYAADVARAWRNAGLALVHVELGDFPDDMLHDLTIRRLLPEATSAGMSRSELADFARDGEPAEATAIRLAESHGLDRVCVHADEWAFSVTRGDAAVELEALETGCLLAATRAANGYFAIPEGVPAGARFLPPPLPALDARGGWSIACCAAPWLEKPVATIGLGDTFLAGTLLVLGAIPEAAGGAADRAP
jgi:ADP-dependent phosphofructokinase/glucokinase